MLPLVTPVISNFIGSFFKMVGIKGIIIIILAATFGGQVLIINKNRNTIIELKVDKKKLEDKLDEIENNTKDLQVRIDSATTKNKQLSVTVGKLREELRNTPLTRNCSELVNEVRETNQKALELWKK